MHPLNLPSGIAWVEAATVRRTITPKNFMFLLNKIEQLVIHQTSARIKFNETSSNQIKILTSSNAFKYVTVSARDVIQHIFIPKLRMRRNYIIAIIMLPGGR